MNTVPKITEPTQIEKQYAIQAAKEADFGETWLVTANRALALQNIAYQTNPPMYALQDSYITAEQARELGAWNAEFKYENGVWQVCNEFCVYNDSFVFKYRAIKQPQSSVAEEAANHQQGMAVNSDLKQAQQAQPVSWNTNYTDSTPKLSVSDSAFEDWFQAQPFATQTGVKQMCRDSYAAGMGDPLVTYATTQAQPEPVTKIDKATSCPCNRKWADCTACKSNFLLSEDEHRAQVWAEKAPEQKVIISTQHVPCVPEPAKEYDEAAFLKRFEINLKRDKEEFFRVTEPVDPYADDFAEESHPAYRAMYAKQVREGTTGFYLWEYSSNEQDWINASHPQFFMAREYRCTDISCYVSKDGEPVIRILVDDAKKLWAETKETHDWFDRLGLVDTEDFTNWHLAGGTYTYHTKATIKLNGRMVTPEQAAAAL
jgi:hypothetical protein